MTKNDVKEITKDEIRDLINQNVGQNTAYSDEFETIQQAIDASVEFVFQRANEFEVLTQETMDDQADNYDDGYLAGACVGDLVFSDDEVLVSEQTITGWYEEETQDNHRKELDVRDIANVVYYELILNRLELYNQSRKNIQ
jgi:hypothetical protein